MATRARVFISCGQNKESPEYRIACGVKKKLEDLNFETDDFWPFVATLDTDGRPLLDEVFRRLEECEYFIFIDFCRERVIDIHRKKVLAWFKKGGEKIRGSLFAYQELAVASYLKSGSREDLILCFQVGKITLDGMSWQMLLNVPADQQFSNINGDSSESDIVAGIARKVQEKVEKKEWDPTWRNELEAVPEYIISEPTGDLDPHRQLQRARYFNIRIRNQHRSKIARNCVVYLKSEVNEEKGNYDEKRLDIAELKWDGIRTRDAFIAPGNDREFNFLRVTIDPTDDTKFCEIRYAFNRELVDSGRVRSWYTLRTPCKKRLFFSIFSENFRPLEFQLDLEVGGDKLDDIKISLTGESDGQGSPSVRPHRFKRGVVRKSSEHSEKAEVSCATWLPGWHPDRP